MNIPKLKVMARNATRAMLVAVTMSAQPTASFAVGEGLADYVVVSWTERDGLPSGDIRSIPCKTEKATSGLEQAKVSIALTASDFWLGMRSVKRPYQNDGF